MKQILKTLVILSSHGHHFPFSSKELLKTMDLLSLHQSFLLYELKLFSSANKNKPITMTGITIIHVNTKFEAHSHRNLRRSLPNYSDMDERLSNPTWQKS